MGEYSALVEHHAINTQSAEFIFSVEIQFHAKFYVGSE